MASEQPVGAGAARPSPRFARAHESRPFYADPLRLAGWGIALLALVSYWWLFGRRPPPSPDAAIARLTGLAGHVRVKPKAREAFVEAQLSQPLRVGDAVRTDAQSGAQISFDNGSVVRVRSDSIVYVGDTAESSAAAWRVSSGRVNFAVGDRATEIRTPSTRTRALANAAGQLDVTDGGTGIKIFSGQAELQTTLGQSVSLAENQAVQVDSKGHAGSRRALPPAPSLLGPATRSELPFAAPPTPVTTLRWTPATGAATYRVAMDFNVTQADLLLSAALDVPGVAETSHAIAGMDPGRYFWRVAGVSADGLEGAFSRVALFSILPPAPPRKPPSPPPPPVLRVDGIEEVSPGVARVAGRVAPGAALTVNGVAVSVLPDGSFGEYVRVGGGGELVLRATARDGRVGELTRRPGGR